MKFLLLAPPKKGMKALQGHPPVGLGYLATALRKLGHEIEIQDCVNLEWDIKDIRAHISNTRPDVVGISVFSSALPSSREIVGLIKESWPKTLVIAGGPHPTAAPQHTLEYLKEVDFGFRGEGEIPLKEFIEMLNGARKPEDVSGLIWRENGRTKWNDYIQHDCIEDFDFPAWDLLRPQNYFKCPIVGDKSAVIFASRGCPFECKFCVKHGKKLRLRSLDHIWKEITLLNKNYGVTRFHLGDEGFPINIKFVKDFCRYAIEKGARYRFEVARGMRLSVLDDEVLELMQQAGFGKYFAVGIESAVPRVRKLMHKQLTQEQLLRGLELLNKHGFRPDGNFILGYPGETKEEMLESVNWAIKSRLIWGAAFTPFMPLPGTEAVREIMENKELPRDFDFSQLGTDCVLYAPKGISKQELDNIRKQAVWRFNFRPRKILYFMTGGRLRWAVAKFITIYFPKWLVPKNWRRV